MKCPPVEQAAISTATPCIIRINSVSRLRTPCQRQNVSQDIKHQSKWPLELLFTKIKRVAKLYT